MRKIPFSIIPIVVFFTSFNLDLHAQPQLAVASATTFIGAENVATNFINNVFAVQAITNLPDGTINYITIGTGFFTVGKPVPNGQGSMIGITCNHVARLADEIHRKLFLGFDATNNYYRCPARVVYTDSANDIAVIIPDISTSMNAASLGIKNMVVDPKIFDEGSSLVLGRGVLTFGYPLSLGLDVNGDHPIVRFGMIAQSAKQTTFLIDGTSSHGNSGSPVFSLEASGPKFLGMVTSFANDNIELFDEHQQVSAQLPYNSGLTVAVKAAVILDAINAASNNY